MPAELPTISRAMVGAASAPTGPAFSLVLLAHIGCVLLALVTVVVSGIQAERLRRSGLAGELPESLGRYYQPGVNWAGRTLHAVPLLGFALLAMSQGAFGLADAWVMIGLGAWVVAAFVAEGVLWPAERRLQLVVSAVEGGATPNPTKDIDLVRMMSVALVVVLIGATVVMVAQP